MSRILLVPDLYWGDQSGAKSARATVENLLAYGHTIGVYTGNIVNEVNPRDKSNLYFYNSSLNWRWYHHFYSSLLINEFKEIKRDFKPEYVLFVGSIQKPAVIAKFSRLSGIRNVFLFYINDYYCQKTYAGLVDGPCLRCLKNPYLPPMYSKCVSLKDFPKFIKGLMVRKALGKEIRKCYKFLGYGREQLDLAINFGVPREKCVKVGFQFDPTDLVGQAIKDEGYFALTGQPIIQKGWHLLPSILANLDFGVRIRASVLRDYDAKYLIKKYHLMAYIENGLLEFLIGMTDRKQYLSFLSHSRGVLIPSIYPTTGEFVLQEALYYAKPVIAFDVGVHKDLLIDRYNAMVAPVGDLKGFANRINEIQVNSDMRMLLSENARSTSIGLYDEINLQVLGSIFI